MSKYVSGRPTPYMLLIWDQTASLVWREMMEGSTCHASSPLSASNVCVLCRSGTPAVMTCSSMGEIWRRVGTRKDNLALGIKRRCSLMQPPGSKYYPVSRTGHGLRTEPKGYKAKTSSHPAACFLHSSSSTTLLWFSSVFDLLDVAGLHSPAVSPYRREHHPSLHQSPISLFFLFLQHATVFLSFPYPFPMRRRLLLSLNRNTHLKSLEPGSLPIEALSIPLPSPELDFDIVQSYQTHFSSIK